MNSNEDSEFTRQIKSFDVALSFSKYLSHTHKKETLLKITNNLYTVKSPKKISEEDCIEYIKLHTSYRIKINNEITQVLNKSQILKLQSKDHIYNDKASGLTWDKSRHLYKKITDIPSTRIKLLNLLHYGGHSDWRIPSIEEIHTITPDIYKQVNLTEENIRNPGNIWSNFCDRSDDDGRFVRLEDMHAIGQYFHEGDKNTGEGSRGYKYRAMNFAVRSSM